MGDVSIYLNGKSSRYRIAFIRTALQRDGLPLRGVDEQLLHPHDPQAQETVGLGGMIVHFEEQLCRVWRQITVQMERN